MDKINVLVFPSDRTGVSKFRSIEPHMKLQELYNDDFFVELITAGTDNFDWDDEKYLKKFDIVHFHRTLPKKQNGNITHVYMKDIYPIFKTLKKLGIITVMDLDDYWSPGPEHPAYEIIKKSGMGAKIIDNLKHVDYVSTTTPLFADEIKKFNKNIIVLPNSIDPEEKQFVNNVEKSDRIRVGWLGGSSHLKDLELATSVSGFLKNNENDVQMVLCGYDLRGNITEMDKTTGQQRTRKIKPEESVWVRYEELFTNNYKNIPEIDIKNLKKFDREFDESLSYENKSYRRVWTKPITSYASNYNLFDISLAPLKENTFNKVKSQLKVIEAGFHKKALIAQDFGPYNIDCVNLIEYGGSINEKGNAILIQGRKNHKDWVKALNRLKKNPELIKLLANNLYETVKDKYHINTVTRTRAEFYKTIVKDNKKEVEQLIEETNEI